MFLGNPSARVRDELWKMAVDRAGAGSVLQVWSYPCPQGYQYRSHHAGERQLVDFEGLALVRVARRRKAGPADEESGEQEGASPSEPTAPEEP